VRDSAQRRVVGLSLWSGPVEPVPLPGGLSNDNFLVEDAGRRYMVRVGQDQPEHAVYRFNEVTVCQAAHEADLSPALIHHEGDVLVFDYVEDARMLAPEDLAEARTLAQLVGLIGRCHVDLAGHLEVPGPMFWVFQVNRRYARILAEAESRLAGSIGRLMEINDQTEEAVGAIRPVFCHNDLMPANVLDDGERLWLIDWEYGGWNCGLYDLADLAAHAEMAPELEAELTERYRTLEPEAHDAQRFAALKCAAAVRAALWGGVAEVYSSFNWDVAAHADAELERVDRTYAAFRMLS